MVYYESREYARVMGDPCLGSVWAASKQEAEWMAAIAGMGGGGGVWCVLAPEGKEKTGERMLGGCLPGLNQNDSTHEAAREAESS